MSGTKPTLYCVCQKQTQYNVTQLHGLTSLAVRECSALRPSQKEACQSLGAQDKMSACSMTSQTTESTSMRRSCGGARSSSTLTGLPGIEQRAGVAPTRALRLCTTAMRRTVATTTNV